MATITAISGNAKPVEKTTEKDNKNTYCKQRVPILKTYRFRPYTKHECIGDRRKIAAKKITLEKPTSATQTFKKVFPSIKSTIEDDSDDETLTDLGTLVTFGKKSAIPAVAMTVPCEDTNIKGSKLIEIVDEIVRNKYFEAIKLASGNGPAISQPKEENGIVSINAPIDWFLSVGGWKGMAPEGEIRQYHFYIGSEKEGDKFKGVQIFNNGLIYTLKEHRIYLPEGFSINGINVTNIGRKTAKTDLSYSQIVKAIDVIKQQFKVDDAKIAALQLFALTRHLCVKREGDWFDKLPKANQQEVLQFLDFLNGLMFGVEPSGLNVALATSLMTLELIEDGRFGYKQAFDANSDGGIYPYACVEGNNGTYTEREHVLNCGKNKPFSMKAFRENPSLSPVCIKEAMLIKDWLKFKKVVVNKMPFAAQLKAISNSVRDLLDFYFQPLLEKPYSVEKSNK